MSDGPPTLEPPADDQAFGLEPDDLLALLHDGEMEIEGRMPYSSNATLLVTMRTDDREHRAIYKPGRGERPLWDFPEGLYRREVAMYLLSEQLGWSVVPPTVLADGPLGEGSLQAFVNAHFAEHYFTMIENDIGRADLERLCVLDLIANNTDRKAGHCLLGADGRVYGIDHGLSFHAQWKLRTVMWDFVGDPIPDHVIGSIERLLDDGPPAEMVVLLDRFEIDAMMTRAKALASAGRFPDDDTGGQRYPWPLV